LKIQITDELVYNLFVLYFILPSYPFKHCSVISGESDALSITSSQSGNFYNAGHLRESKSSIGSDRYGHGQLSATESSRGDDVHDETDNDSLGGMWRTFVFLLSLLLH